MKHTGYTVSYNKDLKLPNWVSYELTRQETKGKEKRWVLNCWQYK